MFRMEDTMILDAYRIEYTSASIDVYEKFPKNDTDGYKYSIFWDNGGLYSLLADKDFAPKVYDFDFLSILVYCITKILMSLTGYFSFIDQLKTADDYERMVRYFNECINDLNHLYKYLNSLCSKFPVDEIFITNVISFMNLIHSHLQGGIDYIKSNNIIDNNTIFSVAINTFGASVRLRNILQEQYSYRHSASDRGEKKFQKERI